MQPGLQEIWILNFAGAVARAISAGNEGGAREAIVALVGYSPESPDVLVRETMLLVALPQLLRCRRDIAERALEPLTRAAIAAIPLRVQMAS